MYYERMNIQHRHLIFIASYVQLSPGDDLSWKLFEKKQRITNKNN